MRLYLLLVLAAICSIGLAPAPFPRVKPRTDPVTLLGRLEGVWAVESCTVGGRVQGGPGQKWLTVQIKRGAWSQSCKVEGRELFTTPYLIRIDPQDASRIDLAYRGHSTPVLRGILRLEGDRLIVTEASSGARPTSHTAKLGPGQVRWVLRRARS
jgi:hypothetical protein